MNFDECMSCGICQDVCKQGAIKTIVNKNGSYSRMYLDHELCIRCGACDNVCPAEA